jgi:hypothetical protein
MTTITLTKKVPCQYIDLVEMEGWEASYLQSSNCEKHYTLVHEIKGREDIMKCLEIDEMDCDEEEKYRRKAEIGDGLVLVEYNSCPLVGGGLTALWRQRHRPFRSVEVAQHNTYLESGTPCRRRFHCCGTCLERIEFQNKLFKCDECNLFKRKSFKDGVECAAIYPSNKKTMCFDCVEKTETGGGGSHEYLLEEIRVRKKLEKEIEELKKPKRKSKYTKKKFENLEKECNEKIKKHEFLKHEYEKSIMNSDGCPSCPVCLEEFHAGSATDARPHVSNCGHVVCVGCRKKVRDKRCPTCRVGDETMGH